jgi:hypothetical protein
LLQGQKTVTIGEIRVQSMNVRASGPIPRDRDSVVGIAHRSLGLGLWWILASVVGGTLSLILWRLLTGIVGGRLAWHTLSDLAGGTLSLFFGFLPLSVAQWLVLRRHLRHPGRWVIASAVGVCLGTYAQRIVIFGLGAAPAILPAKDPQALGVLFNAQLFWGRGLGLFVLWGVVGAAQWLVLRRHFRHAGWWVLASAVAGAVSGALALVVGSASGGLLISYLARWSAYGAMTGLTLVLLRQDHIKRRYQRRIDRAALPGLTSGGA